MKFRLTTLRSKSRGRELRGHELESGMMAKRMVTVHYFLLMQLNYVVKVPFSGKSTTLLPTITPNAPFGTTHAC